MEHTVFIRRVPGYDEKVDRAVEELFAASPRTGALGPQTRALIKPNLLAKHPPDHGVTTHPAVVAACIRALQRRGVEHIVVADSPGGLYNPGMMRSIYQVSGLAQVCRELGVQAYDECAWAQREAQGKLVRRFELLNPVLEADFIVNVPKLKTHVMTGMSCAVKNLFGTVPGLQKAEFHMRFPEKERFGDMLVDLCETVKPSLTVVDGVLAMEGDGPAGGVPRQLGLILGGEDPYAIDLTVCGMMGLDPMAVPYLKAASARGLCPQRADAAWRTGDAEAAAPIPEFRLPKSYTNINFSNRAPRAIRWAVPGVEKWIAPRPKIDVSRCIGCGKCAEICPGHTIRVEKGKAHIDPKGCIRCFCCHEMCPVKAIEVKRFRLFQM
ncbi:DUF362 domain-containing protein [Ruthenibacterium sp. TH_2024_36131]|uniref:DUF362 domain-containing protein n=1 Tax=Owariibacterium komagatae TaxID=3136601 RepID=UPI0038B34C00